MKVKNVIGSSRFPAPKGYDSWLDYWEKQSHQRVTYCGTAGCLGKDLVGAHVQKAESSDKSWYITPLCKSCNQRTDTFEVYTTLVPVPSNL